MENFNLEEQIRFEKAKKRIKSISGFYKHLTVYILVNIFLVAMKYFNLEEGQRFLTFSTFSTAFFWGIGLAFHALSVFGSVDIFLGKNWEDRKIKELMEKDRTKKWE